MWPSGGKGESGVMAGGRWVHYKLTGGRKYDSGAHKLLQRVLLVTLLLIVQS